MSWDKDRIFALLQEAGAIALRVRKDMRYELKADGSIVTPADREIEALFSRHLEQPAKGTYLIGEETVEQKGEDYLAQAMLAEAYVVDPIDGTAPFAHGIREWGVSIGRMEHGVLTDGAVYLPDYGEVLLSHGPAVLEAARDGDRWEWREVAGGPQRLTRHGLLAITQEIAKHGEVHLPNPVLVLGAAVVPMLGLLQGRFLAYLGSVKLWDVAGALPLLLRQGFAASVVEGGERRAVTSRVDERAYRLEAGSTKRWALRSDLLICHPDEELRLRASFRSGNGRDT